MKYSNPLPKPLNNQVQKSQGDTKSSLPILSLKKALLDDKIRKKREGRHELAEQELACPAPHVARKYYL